MRWEWFELFLDLVCDLCLVPISIRKVFYRSQRLRTWFWCVFSWVLLQQRTPWLRRPSSCHSASSWSTCSDRLKPSTRLWRTWSTRTQTLELDCTEQSPAAPTVMSSCLRSRCRLGCWRSSVPPTVQPETSCYRDLPWPDWTQRQYQVGARGH